MLLSFHSAPSEPRSERDERPAQTRERNGGAKSDMSGGSSVPYAAPPSLPFTSAGGLVHEGKVRRIDERRETGTEPEPSEREWKRKSLVTAWSGHLVTILSLTILSLHSLR